MKYNIYTDGSCSRNPGPGGWAIVVMNEESSAILSIDRYSADHTTNNREELKAILCAFQIAEEYPDDEFIIYSDSAYAVNACNSWIRSWAANGWRNSKKQTVENLDLMQALYDYIKRDFFNVEVRKCDGHAGDLGNELADALATSNYKKYKELVEYWGIQEPIIKSEIILDLETKYELKHRGFN